MATFTNRITELIGNDYTTIASNSYLDLFNAAVSEVADMAPPELLLKYAVDPSDLDENTTTLTTVEGKKVLLVTRLDDSSPRLAQECKPVSIQAFEKAKDANSIYLATKYNPVYAYITDGGTTALTILPEPIVHEDVKVYHFTYTTISDLAVSTIAGLPNELENAVVLKACINILQTYISDFVQDEEDAELQQMIMVQIKTLSVSFEKEMARYMEQDATPRGE